MHLAAITKIDEIIRARGHSTPTISRAFSIRRRGRQRRQFVIHLTCGHVYVSLDFFRHRSPNAAKHIGQLVAFPAYFEFNSDYFNSSFFSSTILPTQALNRLFLSNLKSLRSTRVAEHSNRFPFDARISKNRTGTAQKARTEAIKNARNSLPFQETKINPNKQLSLLWMA